MKQEFSFSLSLFLFVLLMCSCKTKEVAYDSNFVSKDKLSKQTISFQSFIDTTDVHNIYIDNSKLKITETITITEYDKESGKPIKETHAKREITQDTDKVSSKEENRGLSKVKKDSLNHIADASKMVETEEEVKEESVMSGMFVNLGKWLGIGLCVIFGIALIWTTLKNKLPL